MRISPFSHSARPPAPSGRRIELRGIVQGVGFRPWVYRVAQATSVTGRVRNHTAGVTIEAFGTVPALDAFVDGLAHEPHRPAAAVIDTMTTETIPFEPADRFQIVESEASDGQRVSIPPDLATCPECLQEIRDPADRRYGYAFTNCTNCGPRFTITSAAPYDRVTTTMRTFTMCPTCRREYETVENRRFHAQPNACPDCGPQLQLCQANGDVVTTIDPLAAAAALVKDGAILAIKGLGGFQLACDATADEIVSRLRERKHRDEKPFAVMVGSLAAARRLADLSPAEALLLESPERPIVLVRRRADAGLAPAVAPRNPLVGVLLANTPLHHLLLDAVARPLVMTSGNLSDEPIAFRNDEAIRRLGSIADAFLMHDRSIVTRCDDSVTRVVAGAPMIMRRSRGYVPRPLAVDPPFASPVLACGALLKNTFCIGRANEAVLGPHIGDLENVATFEAYTEAIARMERFLDVHPDVVAHDMHPDYLSTMYAVDRGAAVHVPVQHHHAHVVSVMAEHGLADDVLGLSYDGTGYGTDGASWGGELLVAGRAAFRRIATFRPIPLAGGDQAIRQPWRVALALLDDAFEGDPPLDALGLFRATAAHEIETIRRMIAAGVNSPMAHGVGRYFDGFGALLLNRARASYEGQIAFELNMAAVDGESGRYPYDILTSSTPWQVDVRQTVRDAVFEAIGGESIGVVAARFHNTLAAASAAIVRMAARQHGRLPVVLSGGCFQNARLTESLIALLEPDLRVFIPRRVPPGDGGLALGQAVAADAIARSL